MMDADRAFEMTRHFFKINEVKDVIENAVEKAVEKGEYTCKVNISSETEQFVRDEIVAWLHGLKYRCTVPKYKSQRGCPVDQMDYWNEINISWESDTMINEKMKKQ